MEKKRTYYLDVLRVLATLFVIIIHISANKFDAVEAFGKNWEIYNIFSSLSRWSVPAFVMISGALFLNPQRQISTKKLYTKNILRLATVFVFWSAAYFIVYKIFGEDCSSVESIIEHFAGFRQLWYIPMIISLYVLVPVFRAICDNEKTAKYFLVASFVLAILPYTFFDTLLPMLKQGVFCDIISYFDALYQNIGLRYFAPYTFYFVLGYYLSIKDIKKSNRYIIYILGVAATIATILLIRFTYAYADDPKTVFYNNPNANIALQSIAVFVLIKNIKWKETDKKAKILDFFAKQSFGVYLTHVIIITVITKFVVHLDTTLYPIISVMIVFVITAIASYIASFILNKIPLVNKYLV